MNIINDLWKDLEKQNVSSFNNPTGYKVLKYLNKDTLQSIIVNEESKRYWLESSTSVPMYIRTYIKKYLKNKGYKYLYE